MKIAGHGSTGKRLQRKQGQRPLERLAVLLSDFYEFLGSKPQPSDWEVRERFQDNDQEWRRYCAIHKLTNLNYLFVLNIKEAWKRNTVQPPNASN